MARTIAPASADMKNASEKRNRSSDAKPNDCCSDSSHAMAGTALCLALKSAASGDILVC